MAHDDSGIRANLSHCMPVYAPQPTPACVPRVTRRTPHAARRTPPGIYAAMPIITALLVVTLSVALSLQLFASIDIGTRLTGNLAMQANQQWALHAALDVARARLATNRQTTGYDALNQPWARAVDDVSWSRFLGIRDAGPLDGIRVSQRISDEQAKFNLNTLITTPQQQDAAPYVAQEALAIYRRLLNLLSLDPALAGVTADILLRQAQAKAHGIYCCTAERTALDNFDSLRSVPGYTPQVLERLRRYVTVLPGASTLNVNTATPLVLAAVIKGLSLEQAEAVLSRRTEHPFVTLADFSTQFSAAGIPGQANNASLGVRSSYYSVLTRVRDGQAERASRALLHRISTTVVVENTRRIE